MYRPRCEPHPPPSPRITTTAHAYQHVGLFTPYYTCLQHKASRWFRQDLPQECSTQLGIRLCLCGRLARAQRRWDPRRIPPTNFHGPVLTDWLRSCRYGLMDRRDENTGRVAVLLQDVVISMIRPHFSSILAKSWRANEVSYSPRSLVKWYRSQMYSSTTSECTCIRINLVDQKLYMDLL